MRRTLAVVAGCLVCATLFAGVAAAAHEEPDRTGIFGVELDADGDATVYNVTAYDLSNETERERYEEFVENETAREAWRDEVAADLEAAAATGRNETDLEMAVHDVSVRTYTVVEESDDEDREYGRVEVTAEWDQLAYHSGAYDLEGRDTDWVLVTEPFRSGFEPGPDRLAIHGPEGYERSAHSQPPQVRAQRNSMLWNPQTADFSEFYAEFVVPAEEDAGEPGGGDAGDGGDGGYGVFLQALLIALVPVAFVLLAMRRRRAD